MKKVKYVPNIKDLIAIGKEAVNGKICKHCGKDFKKETGKERVCLKCQKEIKELWK